MRRLFYAVATAVFAFAAFAGAPAQAQTPPPLPPLPPPSRAEPPPSSPPEPSSPHPEAPSAGTATGAAPPPNEAPAVPPPPPPVVFFEPEASVRAPRYAFWLGGRLGLLGYSGGLYLNNTQTGSVETTGNFVRPGLGLEVDVGARLARRYIPYLALELGLVGAGHRFEGTSAQAGTRFLGLGLRFVAGDVDNVGFAGDISFGVRQFEVKNGGGDWNASGIEIFRLGLGAELRIDRRLTISPMFTLSGGTLTDTSGNISFAPNQGDGQVRPPYTNGANIPGGPTGAQTSYFAFVVGCGVHVDLFGK